MPSCRLSSGFSSRLANFVSLLVGIRFHLPGSTEFFGSIREPPDAKEVVRNTRGLSDAAMLQRFGKVSIGRTLIALLLTGWSAVDQASASGSVGTWIRSSTGNTRWVREAPGGDLTKGRGGATARSTRLSEFLRLRGREFGLIDPASELRTLGERRDSAGFARVDLQQVFEGIDVFAGVMRAHFDAVSYTHLTLPTICSV